MPSRKHQSLTKLLVENPELLVDLLRRHAGVRVPNDLALLSGPETVRVLGSERVADGAVVLRRRGGAVRETFLVEIQLRKDPGKRRAWAAYVVGTWTRMGHPATLVVVTTSRSVARWAAARIDLGRGRMVLRPLVIGPDEIPAELSFAEARAWPERLALSVITHGHKSGSLRLGRVALTVARELLDSGDHRRILLAELLVHFTNERVRRTVEAEMEIEGEVYLTKWGKAYGKMRAQALAEGETKGRAVGRTEALLEALWTVLRGRGLEPTAAQRARIERCRAAKQLERWLARAVVAKTVAEVLRP